MKHHLEHPVLVNPVKWLKIDKYHASNLYQPNHYEATMTSNPFARILSRTNKDSTSFRFPSGNLIKMIPKESNDQKIYLSPIINDVNPEEITAPSYIINNKKFIKYVDDMNQWMRYLPLKYKNANENSIISRTQVIPNISQVYTELLLRDINMGLQAVDTDTENSKYGLQLTNSGPLIEVKDWIVFINLPQIKDEVYVSFTKKNTHLCLCIIKLLHHLN